MNHPHQPYSQNLTALQAVMDGLFVKNIPHRWCVNVFAMRFLSHGTKLELVRNLRYYSVQQHPPRLSTMRTQAGFFFVRRDSLNQGLA
jgi:hypothetical protein